MAASSRADCAPWAFGTSLPHQPRLGRMALPNGRSDRSGVNVWTTSLSWARCICAESCDPMLAITTKLEHIGHWIRMRQSLARFSASVSSFHAPSLAAFTTTTPELKFSVHTGPTSEQAIAATGRGLQQATIRTQRLADRGDVNVDRTLADGGARPHPFHQTVLGDEFAGRLHQDRDDLEGPAAERHGNTARPEFPPAEVDLPLLARIDQISARFRHLALADWIG